VRVDKKFAPVTLTIETEEDKRFLLDILKRAGQQYMANGIFFSQRKHQDSFMQKLDHLEGQIR